MPIHWTWLIPEFVVSCLLWLILAPAAAKTLFAAPLNRLKSKALANDLSYLLGFSLFYYAASFFVPLHSVGLPLLILGLVIIAARGKWQKPDFRIFDLIAVVPVVIFELVYPITLDSNVGQFQFSFFHQFWPLDTNQALDAAYGVSGLFAYWHPGVPIFNHLSVQGPFLTLFVWRTLTFCWGLWFDKKYPSFRELTLGLIVLFGSIFYRREVFVKTSPTGGVFSLLLAVIIGKSETWFDEVIAGWFLAAGFIFGYFGALISIPILFLAFISQPVRRGFILRTFLYSMFFVTPDLIRKLIVFLPHSGLHLIVIGVIWLGVGFVLYKYHLSILKLFKTIKGPILLVPLTAILGSILVSILLKPVLKGEGREFNVYQWFIQREGVLAILVLSILWFYRRALNYQIFIFYFGILFLYFDIFRLIPQKLLAAHPEIGELFWDLQKDAVMISFPLIITFFSVPLFVRLPQKIYIAVILFFLFLQDPLVKRTYSPISPYAPRFSALQSVNEMLFLTKTKQHDTSKSGNLTLYTNLALPEPDIVERIFLTQQLAEVKAVCIDPSFIKSNGPADFDVKAYTIEYVTGAQGIISTDIAQCEFQVLPKTAKCSPGTTEIMPGDDAILCRKVNI